MDKKGSVEQAPLYYALAVVHHFIYNKDPTIIDIIKKNYEETDHESGEISYYLHQPDIMKHAIKWMIEIIL